MKAFVAVASLLGLTAADPFYGYGYGLGGAGLHPTGVSYSNRSPQGLGKREADAEALGLGAGGFIRQSRPGLAQFGIHHNGVGAFGHLVGKRSADAFGYGYAPFRALGGAGLHPTGASYSNRSPQGLGKREADAEAFYAPVLAKGYPSWPGVVAPGFESTCYGCGLGKRSAEADADAFSYTQRSPQGAYGLGFYGRGYGYGKRSADAYGLGLGAGGFIHQSRVHPGYGGYAVGAFAHPVGKRDADAEAYGYGYAPFRALGGAGLHPTGASYSNRSPQGLGKREAEEEGQALALHPNGGTSYRGRTVFGYPPVEAAKEKREAGEEAVDPRDGVVFIGQTVWGFPVEAKAVEKREAEAGISYSNRSPQGAYGWAPYWG